MTCKMALTHLLVIGGNSIESLVLLLATAAIGAVFCSFATDLGEEVLSLDNILFLYLKSLTALRLFTTD